MGFPAPSGTFQIFESLPPADSTTFAAGIPGVTTQEEAVAIVMFSPNLQIIASLDNTDSAGESSYTVDVTTGFTVSSTQSISITSSVGVTIEIVTAGVSTTFALSFTEEFSKSTTKSMSFSCPAGSAIFVYQGTLMSRVLLFNGGTGEYSWSGEAAKALTQVLKTNATPIGTVPTGKVTIN